MIRKIIVKYHLDEMIAEVIGKDTGLFLDLAACSIITKDNAGQAGETDMVELGHVKDGIETDCAR